MSTRTKARDPLTRDRIVRSAVEYADEEGIDSLSMRGLARHLGFEAMSLYNHVANKDDLLTAMVDHIVAAAGRPPVGESGWRGAIRQNAIDVKDQLQRHPWAAMLWTSTLPGPERFRLMEWQLATVNAADLDEETAHHAFHAVGNHTVGYAMQSTTMPDDQELDMIIDDIRSSLDPVEFQHVLAHIQQHVDGHHGPSFEFVLDIILDAIDPG